VGRCGSIEKGGEMKKSANIHTALDLSYCDRTVINTLIVKIYHKLHIIFIVYTLFTKGILFAQWPMTAESELIIGGGCDPQAVSDGNDGVIVCWQNFGNPGGIYMQRVDKNGYIYYPEPIHIQGVKDTETLIDHKIVTDGKGGMYVLFQDILFWDYPNVQNRHLRLHHIDSSGTFLWGKSGILIATPVDTTQWCGHNPTGSCIYDGEGGLIVAWHDFRHSDQYSPYGHIFIQKYNSEGESLWDIGGIQLTDSVIQCEYPLLSSDNEGGVYVYCWFKLLCHIDRYGSVKYLDSVVGINDTIAIQSIDSDFEGGFYFTAIRYTDYPDGFLYCQRIHPDKGTLWQDDIVLDSCDRSYPWRSIKSIINTDSTLSIINRDNYIYRIGPRGDLIFCTNVVAMDTISVQGLVSDINSANIVLGVSNGVYGSKFNKNGRIEWENQPILISYEPENNIGDVVVNEDGSLIITMEQSYGYIALKKISKNGNIGGEDTSIKTCNNISSKLYFQLFQNYPNPFNTITKISYQLYKSSKICLSIYTLGGHEVIRLVDSKQNRGYHEYLWNGLDKYGKSVSSGIYIYCLQIDTYKKSFTATLIK